MNTYELVSSVVDSLAWPISVLIIILILKSPINKLFNNLSRLKYNELEMDFLKGLETVDENLHENVSPNIEQIEKNSEMELLISSNPVSAVLISFKNIEEELQNTIIRLELAVDSSPIASDNINLLRENGLFDLEIASSLFELMKLRNMVAHQSASLTPAAARHYYELSRKLINKLKQLEIS